MGITLPSYMYVHQLWLMLKLLFNIAETIYSFIEALLVISSHHHRCSNSFYLLLDSYFKGRNLWVSFKNFHCSIHVRLKKNYYQFYFYKHSILLYISTGELVQSDTWVFRHSVTSDKIYGPKVFLLSEIKPEYSTPCTTGHISLVPLCVGLDSFHCSSLSAILVSTIPHPCSTHY